MAISIYTQWAREQCLTGLGVTRNKLRAGRQPQTHRSVVGECCWHVTFGFLHPNFRGLGFRDTLLLFGSYYLTVKIVRAVTLAFRRLAAVEARLEGEYCASVNRVGRESEEVAFYNGGIPVFSSRVCPLVFPTCELNKGDYDTTKQTGRHAAAFLTDAEDVRSVEGSLGDKVNGTQATGQRTIFCEACQRPAKVQRSTIQRLNTPSDRRGLGHVDGSCSVQIWPFPSTWGRMVYEWTEHFVIQCGWYALVGVDLLTTRKPYITHRRLLLSLADAGRPTENLWKDLVEVAGLTGRGYPHCYQHLTILPSPDGPRAQERDRSQTCLMGERILRQGVQRTAEYAVPPPTFPTPNRPIGAKSGFDFPTEVWEITFGGGSDEEGDLWVAESSPSLKLVPSPPIPFSGSPVTSAQGGLIAESDQGCLLSLGVDGVSYVSPVVGQQKHRPASSPLARGRETAGLLGERVPEGLGDVEFGSGRREETDGERKGAGIAHTRGLRRALSEGRSFRGLSLACLRGNRRLEDVWSVPDAVNEAGQRVFAQGWGRGEVIRVSVWSASLFGGGMEFYNGGPLERDILTHAYLRLREHVNSIYKIQMVYEWTEDFVIQCGWVIHTAINISQSSPSPPALPGDSNTLELRDVESEFPVFALKPPKSSKDVDVSTVFEEDMERSTDRLSGPAMTLVRALNLALTQLWTPGGAAASISRPTAESSEDGNRSIVVPERAYMVSGSLLEQLEGKDLGTVMNVSRGGEADVCRWHFRMYFVIDQSSLFWICTSAVSSDVEGQMYEHAKSLGISFITISLRPSLTKYHTHLLTPIGDDTGSWTFTSIFASSATSTSATPSITYWLKARGLGVLGPGDLTLRFGRD
ncbi:hypothetical protein BU15DRAFT_64310 [Melanogaster broomeanus]|nr:hypothetical protein BU15DRAFT_64310 [Melanogaster broomeanus]